MLMGFEREVMRRGRRSCWRFFGSWCREEGIEWSKSDPSLIFSHLGGGLHITEVGSTTRVFAPKVLVTLVLATLVVLVTVLLAVLAFTLGDLAAPVVVFISVVIHGIRSILI